MTPEQKDILNRLRETATVCGVCLCRDGEIVTNLFPYSEERMSKICGEADAIFADFQARGRRIERLVVGFDAGQMLIVNDRSYRLLVMHLFSDEADFLAKAGLAFLSDLPDDRHAVVATAANGSKNPPRAATAKVTTIAEGGAAPTGKQARKVAAVVRSGPATEINAVVVQPPRLAAQQPTSTLPPPKKPRLRRKKDAESKEAEF